MYAEQKIEILMLKYLLADQNNQLPVDVIKFSSIKGSEKFPWKMFGELAFSFITIWIDSDM